MKKAFFQYSFVFVTLLLMSACSSDPCEGVVCHNNGVPVESGDDCICDCPAGFAGNSCETDLCSLLDCKNQGEAVPNQTGDECFCDCPIGFEGEDCSEETRVKFAGNFAGSEDCGSQGSFNIAVTVSYDATNTNSRQFMITGLFEPNLNVDALITGKKTFDIESQNVSGAQGTYNISGSGSFEFDGAGNVSAMNASYSLSSGTVNVNCSVNLNKQN